MQHFMTRKEFRILNKARQIYVLVSGGLDSTFAVLNMFDLRFWIKKPVILLHADTRNQLTTAKTTLRKLRQYVLSDWQYEEYIPFNADPRRNLKPKSPIKWIIDSLKLLDKAENLLREGNYSKRVFPCCYHLKHKPFYHWSKIGDHRNDVFISSIRGGESHYRQIFLGKLRKKKTKFHLHKKTNLLYYYPLRDINAIDVKNYFLNKAPVQFLDIYPSHCKICPITVLFKGSENTESFDRTMRVVKRLKQRKEIQFDLSKDRDLALIGI